MSVVKKEQAEARTKLTCLQQAHLAKRKRHPTQSQIRLASDHEQIRIDLHNYFSMYISAEAESLLDQIESAIFALRNEALASGVSPSARMNLNLLLKWKDSI